MTHSFPRKRGKGLRANEFAAWAKERQGKSLDQLQIEQCRHVLDNVDRLHGFSAEQEERYLDRLREQVAEIEKSGVPIITGKFARTIRPLYASRIAAYQSKYGERARSQLRKRQTEQEKVDEIKNEKDD